MESQFDSSSLDKAAETGVSREEIASVMTTLEPDQIVSAKDKHHFPRRQLTRPEKIMFWTLRAYLSLMVGVVIYQIWIGVR